MGPTVVTQNIYSNEKLTVIRQDPFKQMMIEGGGYLLSGKQLMVWIEVYGDIESKIFEEPGEYAIDGTCSGTGSYLISVRLNNKFGIIIPWAFQ